MVESYFQPHADLYMHKNLKEEFSSMSHFHFHNQYEIYYQIEGLRKYYIDDQSYLVNPKSLVLIDKNCIHKAMDIEGALHSRLVINFSDDFIANVRDAFLPQNILTCFQSDIKVIPLNSQQQKYIEVILGRIWDEYCGETVGYNQPVFQLGIANLLVSASKYIQELSVQKKAKDTKPNILIDSVKEYISTHYREHLTLTEIAAKFFVSPFHLSRSFKKDTEFSIIEYINNLRLAEARYMLEKTTYSIGEISDMTGFSTPAHFSRVFRSIAMVSPQKYRSMYIYDNVD